MATQREAHTIFSEAVDEKVYFEHNTPEGRSCGAVLLLHGLGDHIGIHEWAIELIVEQGFEVVALDWPGSGKSGGIRGDLPRVSQVGKLIEEVLDSISVRPVGVLAHSTGGFFLLNLLTHSEEILSHLRWVWLSSPLLRPQHGQSSLKIGAAKILAKVFPRLTLSTGVHPSDCYHVAANEDPDHFTGGCHNRASLGFGADILIAGSREDPFVELNLKRRSLLVTQGSEDTVCPPQFIFKLFQQTDCEEKTFLYASDSRHEPFREPDSEGLIGSIRQWMRIQRSKHCPETSG